MAIAPASALRIHPDDQETVVRTFTAYAAAGKDRAAQVEKAVEAL